MLLLLLDVVLFMSYVVAIILFVNIEEVVGMLGYGSWLRVRGYAVWNDCRADSWARSSSMSYLRTISR